MTKIDPGIVRVVEGFCYNKSGKRVNWTCDISDLWNGRTENKSRCSLQGRPDLGESVYPVLCIFSQGIARESFNTMMFHLTKFWVFLDEMESVMLSSNKLFPSPTSALEVPGQTWMLFKDWLAALATSGAHYSYYFCAKIFGKVGELLGEEGGKLGFPLPPNPFENEQKIKARTGDANDQTMDEVLIKKVSSVLFYQVEGTRMRLEHPFASQPFAGASTEVRDEYIKSILSSHGSDPSHKMVVPWAGGDSIPPWFENSGVTKSELYLMGRWFVPSDKDLLPAFALVSLRHGWNTSVTLALDPDDWFCHHQLGAKKVIKIFSRKMRAGGVLQNSYSRESASNQTYQILLSVLAWTRPLRLHLEDEATLLKKRIRSESCGAQEKLLLQKRLARVGELLKSFWLYLTAFGEITSLDKHLKYKNINMTFEAAGIIDSKGPFKFSQSICRNSWALFAFETSGFNALVVRVALGHADLRTVLHYLDQKFVRNRNRREFIGLQTAILELVKVGKLSIASLRKLVKGVSAEKVFDALGDGGAISRQGMACADPTQPDKEADPGHKEGQSCRSQKCLLGCSKAFITFSTLEYAARRVLELREIRDSTPLPAWTSSDNPHDLQFLEDLMGLFSKRNVEIAMQVAAASKGPTIFTVPSRTTWDRRAS